VSRGREVLVGSVIIAAVTVGVVGTLWMKGTNWGRTAVPIEVLLTDVAQLSPGSAVKFRGVQVGRVALIQVEPDGQAVRVTLELDTELTLPSDAAVLLAPESFFGDWQAEIVPRSSFPGFDFQPVPPRTERDGVLVLGGYTLPEMSRLTASAEQISTNLAALTDRFEIAFNDSTAVNLARAIENFGVVSEDLRTLVDQQADIAMNITFSVDSAMAEIEASSRVARRSFERIDQILADAQIDSIVGNVNDATGDVSKIAADLAESSDELAAALARADSAFARIDRLTARVEAGQGALGRMVADTTLAVRAEDAFLELSALLKDLRENPKRYVRLTIF
jgi:phospholipid/cholesterol/gamma-HCH transport system substrate-binding protein